MWFVKNLKGILCSALAIALETIVSIGLIVGVLMPMAKEDYIALEPSLIFICIMITLSALCHICSMLTDPGTITNE